MKKISIYDTPETDPYRNLALEAYLFSHTAPGECVLYLWQNAHTVVIGRNQNAWKECNVSLLEQEGGRAARRLSGGGAVYHDLGNLNFTFLTRKGDYDVQRQLQVIQKAVASFGISAGICGRNDLMAEGRKFSGNAFYESGDCSYHHGTLLVDADMEKMSRYLTVSRDKLDSKGVDSVRSRVGNLKEWCADITIDAMKAAMEQAFRQVYAEAEWVDAGAGERMPADDILRPLREQFASWEWIYGRRIPFTHHFNRRFSWGGVEIQLKVTEGLIREAKIYSDALELSVAAPADHLKGCAYERQAVRQRVLEMQELQEPFREDLAALLWEAI